MAEVKKKQKIADKLLNGGGVFTFLRSIVSSQVGSWVDFGMSMLFYSLILVSLEPLHRSNLSVAIGAISGGVVNCYINYCFTFHAQQQSIKAIVVKYAMVWVGSLLLNMYGTTGLAYRPSGSVAHRVGGMDLSVAAKFCVSSHTLRPLCHRGGRCSDCRETQALSLWRWRMISIYS